MKFAIRLLPKVEANLNIMHSTLVSALSEHTGRNNFIPKTFDSIEQANLYAENYGLKNFVVEAAQDETPIKIKDIGQLKEDKECSCGNNCKCK